MKPWQPDEGAVQYIDRLKTDIERLTTGLREILGVAQTNKIIDKRGRAIEACDLTCLNECAAIALELLGEAAAET